MSSQFALTFFTYFLQILIKLVLEVGTKIIIKFKTLKRHEDNGFCSELRTVSISAISPKQIYTVCLKVRLCLKNLMHFVIIRFCNYPFCRRNFFEQIAARRCSLTGKIRKAK